MSRASDGRGSVFAAQTALAEQGAIARYQRQERDINYRYDSAIASGCNRGSSRDRV